jgi:hypothetical protein
MIFVCGYGGAKLREPLCLVKSDLNHLCGFLINRMGNTESTNLGADRPGPLMEEAARNITMGFHEPAIIKYRRAYELHKESGANWAAARALRLAAETGLLAPKPDYELGAKAFEEVAELCADNELGVWAARPAYMFSILCLLAAGRIKTAKGKLEEFGKKDAGFLSGLDGITAKVVLETFDAGNKNHLRDRIEGIKDIWGVVVPWKANLLEAVVERI